MSSNSSSEVTVTSDAQDRWWPVGPVAALVALATLGVLDLLILLLNIGFLTWVGVNGLPDDLCADAVDCADVNVLGALPQFLIPFAILAFGAVFTALSFRGPKSVSARPRRWTMSAIGVACPIVVFVWVFV